MYEDGVNAIRLTSSTGVKLNTWNHIATTRVTGTTYHYINGTQVGTIGTQLGSIYVNAGAVPTVGREAAYNGSYFPGYISNLRIVKGTAVYTGNFTPPTAPLTAIANTSLLTLQYKQGSNNNGFIDSSQNNSLITKVGTPTQGTSSPFSQTGWSGSFSNILTDYLTVPTNTAFNLGAGNFTIEGWYNFNVLNIQGQGMFIFSGTTTYNPHMMVWDNGVIYFRSAETSGEIVTPFASGMTVGTWYHWAVTRVGNVYTIYKNGVSVSTATSTAIVSENKSVNIGTALNGSISNFRIVKGVAVYTGTFTPPTAPLTITQSAGTNISAITGTQTSLLILQDNRFKDNSTNAFAITVAGTTKVQAFSPFAPTAAYDAATNGGAMYFNATTTDYLTVPANNFTTGGNWTVECWSYSTSAAVTEIILNGLASDRLYIEWVNGSLVVGDAIANTLSTGNVKPVNQWYHLAVVKSGTAYTAYINGISIATSTTALTAVTLTTWQVGARTAQSAYFTGHMSNLRIVNGVAVYTGAFTPPTLGFVKIDGPTSAASYPSTTNVNTTFPASNTSLLINGTNGGIIDATSKNSITTAGDARISTAQKKYGTGSMYFDGTGDYLSLPSSINNALGAVFTLEFWIYPISHGGKDFAQFGAFELGYSSASAWGIAEVSVAWRVTTTTLPTLNTWNHIAIVRTGTGTNQTTIYLNGISVVVGTYDLVLTSAVSAGIGAATAGTSPFNGYIDDFRITKYARYTANFTPPVGGFPAQ